MTNFSSPEHYKEHLNNLDPDELIAELRLSTDKLIMLLEDYIYDWYVSEYCTGDDEEEEEDHASETG